MPQVRARSLGANLGFARMSAICDFEAAAEAHVSAKSARTWGTVGSGKYQQSFLVLTRSISGVRPHLRDLIQLSNVTLAVNELIAAGIARTIPSL